MDKEEKLIEAMMGLGLARVCLKKALAALTASQAESDLLEITKDYIMEANANYLYHVENTLGEVLKAERREHEQG